MIKSMKEDNIMNMPGFLRDQFGEPRYVYPYHLGTCKRSDLLMGGRDKIIRKDRN